MSVECDCILSGCVEVHYNNVNSHKDIMVVGESPGYTEVKAGEPFVGPSGKLLRNAMKTAKIDPSECAICNSARCLINKKEVSTKQITEILKSCRHKLEHAISAVRPKIIILLGDIALKQVLKTSGITNKRGRFTYNEEFQCWVLPTFHPAYILRAREMEPYLIEDLRSVKRFIDNDYRVDSGNTEATYREVQSIRSLLLSINEATSPVFVALDTETQGLNHNDQSSNFLISYSISASENTGCQIFLREPWLGTDDPAEIEHMVVVGDDKHLRKVYTKRSKRFIEKLTELKELVDHRNVVLIMQNGKFDKHHIRETFRVLGMEPPEFKAYKLDLQIAAHVIEENMYKTISLESLTRTFLQKNDNWKQEFGDVVDKMCMIEAPRDALTRYACEDADNTLQIGLKLRKILIKDKKLSRYFAKVAMPICSEALFTMEENGIYIDQELLPTTKAIVSKNVSEIHKKAIDLIPEPILNEHSSKGLKLSRNHLIADVLFSPLGFGEEPIAISSASGVPMVNSSIRSILKSRDISEECRQFLDLMESWSELSGLLAKIVKQVEGYVCPDGRLRSTFSNSQAVTGRISSSRPNLMSIPKRSASSKYINKLIAAPSSDWLLVEADASQSELRCISHVSGDKEMMRVYINDEDIHTNTAKSLARGVWDSMSKEEQKAYRTKAKCFHPETEVLTKHGWVPLSDYDGVSEILQATPNGPEVTLEWTTPLFHEIRPTHCDSLIWLHNEGMDIKVTPDHRMLVYSNKTHSVTKPMDVNKSRGWWNAGILPTGTHTGATPREIRLAVATQADGSYTKSSIRFGFIKQRKIDRMRLLMEGDDYYETTHKNGINKPTTSFRMDCLVAAKVKSLLDEDKTFPWWWLSLPLRDRFIILDELANWDGTSNSKWTQFAYSSVVKKNCDVIQAIAVSCGLKSKLCMETHSIPDTWRPCYKLSISNHATSRGGNLATEEIPYTDRVAVIAVESSYLVVRGGSSSYRQVPIVIGQSGNFGIVYGISPNGFVNYCRTSYGLSITQEEASSIIASWFGLYPGILKFHERAIEACREYGYTSSPLGRRRRLPQIHSGDLSLRSAAERQAINFPIQSMSSDMMLISLLEIMKDTSIRKEDCFPCLFIHDSLLFQIKKDRVGEYIPIIRHHIEHPPLDTMFGIKLKVPLKADVKIGRNRTDMEEVTDA